MKDILETIIANKRQEVAEQKKVIRTDFLSRICDMSRPAISMKRQLKESSSGIIAEFKRRSPSKGWIKEDADADIIPADYEAAGATALSILTDSPFFGGSLEDIRTARPTVGLPILRKDFIIDEYQLYQAKAVNADAILLIAAALTRQECRALTQKAHELHLEVLLELHSENELDYIDSDIDMIGVNNRHLGTFRTDVKNSFRMAEMLPSGLPKVSESGISQPETVRRLREAGFRGFLIGEAFMKSENPAKALDTFIRNL